MASNEKCFHTGASGFVRLVRAWLYMWWLGYPKFRCGKCGKEWLT